MSSAVSGRRSAVKLAFVTPWYGENIPGGAEAEARRTAEHLARDGYTVEVLTTCIKDFYGDWGKNYYRPKTTQLNGVTVRRFKVKKRDKAQFDAINAKLMKGVVVSAEDEQTYINNMLHCPDLYQYIEKHQNDYLFVFIPYMFATTYFGSQIAPQRSIVIPCLHDEAYARMSLYRTTLPQVKALVLHTFAEKALADQLLGDSTQSRQVLGEGVDTDLAFNAERFRQKFGLHEPFVLYAGRREAGKNTPLLIDYWRKSVGSGPFDRLRTQQLALRQAQDAAVDPSTSSGRSSTKLVLMGSGEVGPLPPNTMDLGFVSRQDMLDGMAAASIFVNPSLNESFSLVLMEAWLAGTPTLVHGGCAVTKEHVTRCNGGLYFDSADEFAATINYLLTHPAQASKMGQLGRSYVLDNFAWPRIVASYRTLIEETIADL